MALVTIRQTPIVLKNGKTAMLEENNWEFCENLWREIKSYLFTKCCATCATQTDDLTCLPSATAYYDGSFIINTAWVCRSCALDPRIDMSSWYPTGFMYPHKSHFGDNGAVVKDIRCVFKHPNVLRGGVTGFREWLSATSVQTLPGRLSKEIKLKNEASRKLVKPKGMRWATWERQNYMYNNTGEEMSYLTVKLSLNVSCSRKTGPLVNDNLRKWIKIYFAEQKADWIQRLKN